MNKIYRYAFFIAWQILQPKNSLAANNNMTSIAIIGSIDAYNSCLLEGREDMYDYVKLIESVRCKYTTPFTINELTYEYNYIKKKEIPSISINLNKNGDYSIDRKLKTTLKDKGKVFIEVYIL